MAIGIIPSCQNTEELVQVIPERFLFQGKQRELGDHRLEVMKGRKFRQSAIIQVLQAGTGRVGKLGNLTRDGLNSI